MKKKQRSNLNSDIEFKCFHVLYDNIFTYRPTGSNSDRSLITPALLLLTGVKTRLMSYRRRVSSRIEVVYTSGNEYSYKDPVESLHPYP